MSFDADVIVVGGGLAGSATAIGLSRAGLRTLVVEKQSFPRDKPCGEGLLPHGVARLRALGLGGAVAAAEGRPFRGILYRAGGLEAAGDFEGGEVGYGVRRRLLDAHVHGAAAGAPGVEVVKGAARGLAEDEGGVAVTLACGRRLRGRAVVGADGPRSAIRHTAGLDGGAPADGRYGIRRHFRLAPGVPPPERVEVTFLGGYELYLTPSGPDVVGVAALCERATMESGAGSKEARLDTLLAAAPAALRERLAGAEPLDAPLACGPLRVRARAVARGRVVLVGDAAGYVDAITGEGMSLALGTAAAASAALAGWLGGGAARADALARYARGHAALFRDHELLTRAVVFLARRPALARRAVALLAADPALFGRLLSVNHGARPLASLLVPARLGRVVERLRGFPIPKALNDLWGWNRRFA